MEDWSDRMNQERARLAFMDVLPLDSQWMQSRQTRPSAFRLAQFLHEHHRLRGVNLVRDLDMKSFKRGPGMSSEFARFDEPSFAFKEHVELSGVGGKSRTSPADLIVITASGERNEERIVAATAPLVQDRSQQHESYTRKHPEHFMGWDCVVPRASLPQQPHTLKAYVFDYDRKLMRPMDGIHEVKGLP
jgi:hypothetical protein